MIRKRLRQLRPFIVLFVVLSGLFVVARERLETWNADVDVLMGGNLLVFLITVFSLLVALSGLQHTSAGVFVRSVYSSMMIKLFLGAGAAFVYILLSGDRMNKPALFICMGLYILYTFVEVSLLMKLLRKKPDA